MKERRHGVRALSGLIVLLLWLAACGGAPSPVGPAGRSGATPDLLDRAAAEATAILQQAQATALVLQARAEATALFLQAEPAKPENTALSTRALPQFTPTPGTSTGEQATPPVEASGTQTVTDTVELLWVGFAAEGAYVIVNYVAPPSAAQTFWPGVLSVTDEASETVFNEVPVLPVIGPLIARPIEAGQPGYVMLVHVPAILRSGSLVTVNLGGYVFEHVPVQ